MIAIHEPPAIVEQAPESDVPFDDTLPDLADPYPDDARGDPADPDPDRPDREAGASPGAPAAFLHAERTHLCDFLVALADLDRRGTWRRLGHPSLLTYLTRELGLSAASAYQRTVAVRLLRHFPEVEEPLRDGRLCLAQVADLARAITPENRVDVLRRFSRDRPRLAAPRAGNDLATRLRLGNDWPDALRET